MFDDEKICFVPFFYINAVRNRKCLKQDYNTESTILCILCPTAKRKDCIEQQS